MEHERFEPSHIEGAIGDEADEIWDIDDLVAKVYSKAGIKPPVYIHKLRILGDLTKIDIPDKPKEPKLEEQI